MKQPEFWAKFKTFAKKLIPSRSVRWAFLYVPGFTLALLFALKTVGGLDDLVAYVMESGARSVPILIGIAITYGLATGLGWNLDNGYRARLQRILSKTYNDDDEPGDPIGAFLILAGEMLSILVLLVIILRALLVWQG